MLRTASGGFGSGARPCRLYAAPASPRIRRNIGSRGPAGEGPDGFTVEPEVKGDLVEGNSPRFPASIQTSARRDGKATKTPKGKPGVKPSQAPRLSG